MWSVGSNVPGYLPDVEIACDSWDEATAVLEELVDEHAWAMAKSQVRALLGEAVRDGVSPNGDALEVSVVFPASDSAHDLGRVFWIMEGGQ